MRNFIIKTVIDNRRNQETNESSIYYDQRLEILPKLSTHFMINGEEFRCIEHKPGKVVLRNKSYTLVGVEKNPNFKPNGLLTNEKQI